MVVSKKLTCWRWLFCTCLLITLSLSGALAGEPAVRPKPTPPLQPESGPGGSEYIHRKVSRYSFGQEATQFFIFEPGEPRPATAPVIVFLHGWTAINPEAYGSWIDHLVRRGNIVIYPRYQATLFSLPVNFTPSAIKAIREAFKELEKEAHVKADLARVAAVGHSFGGVLAANLAAMARSEKLPDFKAVVSVEPGTGGFGAGVYQDYSRLPAGTILLCIAGAEDGITGDADAKRLFREATNVARDDKDYIVMQTDCHGAPPLWADHFIPVAHMNKSDALRWYGLWKWLDAATDVAFYGKNRAYALGNTPEQRFMGLWSDGQPVVEPVISKDP